MLFTQAVTFADKKNAYAVMDTSGGSASSKATLTKELKTGTYCLKFWYAFYGGSDDTLKITTRGKRYKSKTHVLWQRKGGKSSAWQYGTTEVSFTTGSFIVSYIHPLLLMTSCKL